MNPECTRLVDVAQAALGRPPAALWWIPGRIEVLGKHTDYAGGGVLTCATDLGLIVAMAPRTDRRVRVHLEDQVLDWDLADLPTEVHGSGIYLRAVLRRLERNFGLARGVDLAVASNLPPAAGMSSSSAFLTGLTFALAEANDLPDHPAWRAELTTLERLAHYLGCIENGSSCGILEGEAGVGTGGGCMDHTAILLARRGHLTRWSFGPTTRVEDVLLPVGYGFLVLVSGVVAEKTGAAKEAYNAVSRRAREALALWNDRQGRTDRHLGAALAAVGVAPLLAGIDDPRARRRAAAFAAETAEVLPAAVAALARGDLADFAVQTARSMDLAVTHLGNQVPETIDLVALARASGAVAASAFGAGFGGSVWALVPLDQSEAIAQRWLGAYQQRHPGPAARASVTCCRAAEGLTRLV